MEPVDHWKVILGVFGQVVGQLGDDQWDLSTPCPDWTIRELLDHVVEFQRSMIGQLDAPDTINTPLGDDPRAGWRSVSTALEAAVDGAGALDQAIVSPFSDAPFRESIMIPTVDLVFHTWDLARAAGIDVTLPEQTCAAVYELMLPFDEAIRQSAGYPDGYADKVESPAGADIQTQLLCFGGRRP
jgi:uncharacterized protein (TIGR03086 family)